MDRRSKVKQKKCLRVYKLYMALQPLIVWCMCTLATVAGQATCLKQLPGPSLAEYTAHLCVTATCIVYILYITG